MGSPGESAIYCRGCGYDLRMLQGRRCPECGRGFDPADPRSVRRSLRRNWVRWVRRGAGAVLALLLLLAGAWGWCWWQWNQEQSALGKLPGCSVVDTRQIGPAWLGRRLGPGRFALERVTWLDASQCTATDFSPLAKLTRLQTLNLYGTPVTDLSPLRKLTGLQWLNLTGTPVTDLSPLGKLTGLRKLWVPAETVTQEQAETLRKQFPACQISRE